jgi:hypothetical protein
LKKKKCDWARSLFKEKGSPGKAFVIIKSSEVPELKKKNYVRAVHRLER